MPGPSSVSVASVRFNSGLSVPARRCGSVPGTGRSSAPWPPIAASCERREDQVNIVEQAAAYQCECTAGQVLQTRQRMPQLGRHPDFPRGRRDIENGAVDVEQDGAFPQVRR